MRRVIVLCGLVGLLAGLALAFDCRPLVGDERTQEWATHVVTIRAQDLTNSVNGATQLISAVTIAATSVVELIDFKLITPFQDNQLLLVNTNLFMQVGNNSTSNRYLAAMSVNASNGPVYYGVGATNKVFYSAADAVVVSFAAGPTNKLNQFDAGEVKLFFKVLTIP